jgi:NAD(P)-dependent dehydrogenase (short-subunit alcohol dehydrogenase family)
VNSVAPGLIEVDATRDEIGHIPAEVMKTHLANVALGRLDRAEDLVGPILFLLGSGAGFVIRDDRLRQRCA